MSTELASQWNTEQTQALDVLATASEAFAALQIEPGAHVANYNRVVGELHDVVSQVIACLRLEIPKEAILAALGPARDVHSRSPFIHRCQTWPRGFPGDYETIEYLYYAENRAEPDTVPYYCEEYALLSASTQQHRNKLHHQAQLVSQLLMRAKEPVRILSLAGGSSLEFQGILPILEASSCELVLNDTDPDALNVAQLQLKSLGERCQTLPGNVVEVLAFEAEELGTFDLILTGGLFDYLTDKHVGFVLRNARNQLLKTGGSVFFTNVATGNPYGPWMEYLADWALLERSEEDVMRLAKKAKFGAEDVAVQRDATRLTWLVSLTKSGE